MSSCDLKKATHINNIKYQLLVYVHEGSGRNQFYLDFMAPALLCKDNANELQLYTLTGAKCHPQSAVCSLL